jgi:hypothetical protein
LLGPSDVAWGEPMLSELARTFWKLDHIDGVPTEQDSVIVQISKDEIAFSAPCGAKRYPFRYDKSGLVRFHPAWSTTGDTRCTAGPALGKIEPSLARVKRHALNGDALTLLDENVRAIMALSRVTATGLENREWAIAEYWDGKALVPAESAYIVLVHGRIRGSPGCGGLLGDYSLSGERVRLSFTVFLFGLACHQPAMAQMERLTDALIGDWLVEHEPRRTVLRDLQGAVRFVLTPLMPAG